MVQGPGAAIPPVWQAGAGPEDAAAAMAMPMPVPMPTSGEQPAEDEAKAAEANAPGTAVVVPGSQVGEFAAGGGVDGLSIKMNMIAEGLERTQEFVGNAHSEAEEMLQAICENIAMIRMRLERVEVLTGLGSPPSSPRPGEGPGMGMGMGG